MKSYAMTINGKSTTSESSFDVHDPATGEVCGHAPSCTDEQLDQAIRAAQDAFRSWARNESERRNALIAAGNLIRASAAELADLITIEQGKPLRESRAEVGMAADWFDYYAALPIPQETLVDDGKRRIELLYQPAGVVAAITPWNFPLSSACWKIAPALRAGNTVVLKPSPYTPLIALALGELLRSILPAGVLNIVTGDDQLGAKLVSHPGQRLISITGSVETGKAIAASAVDDLKRTILELGGNDPAILLDDVLPERVAKQLFWGAFYNCGQICTAIKRVYVPDSIYDETVEALADVARTIAVGDGKDPASRIGPINNPPQFERVRGLVDDAVAKGAVARAGGHGLERLGSFFSPTVLAEADDTMRVVAEEQFGPALPIIRYHTIDEAIEAANGTEFGLGASIWSADSTRARALTGELECGTVWINSHNALPPDQPFGGRKWSGIGVENGRLGLTEYLEPMVVHELL
jgi:acyl-CoA reductase-like NAD-dependent aldehyde dehydrogenase